MDFAFIDGNHDGNSTINYYNQIAPNLSNEAIIIFDDIMWSINMFKAWNKIRKDSRVSLSINIFRLGICIIK
ncbi:MAG: class I SAM-dependent methyltransferase [Candidatus Marinimicrobia bacterium]|nr:class I SAM-dependent methyltransferase [Candidatus Neomarinimicrobiota bacterium]